MLTLANPADLGRPAVGVCMAMGLFDGVHLGHQHVVRQAVLDARASGAIPVAVTFHPHPLSIVHPDRAPRLLQSPAQRLRALAALGLDATLLLPFDRDVAAMEGATFIERLATGFGRLRSITVGQGFHFGHGRTGNVPLLRALGRSHGFATHAVAPIHIGPERVSSTRIRAALREGRLGLAAELLGRPYALGGTVVAGRQLGRQLGFPTANIDVSGLELPPHGVYAARANLDGLRHRAVINLGQRPTVDGGASTPLLEVHLLDLRPDLYGRELEVELVAWLRPERRFPSIESLREQISHDVDSAREALG